MKKTILLISFSALLYVVASAQISVASAQIPNDSCLMKNNGHLNLDIDAEAFFFNAEYGTPFVKGFTVPGFRLSPTLVYGINEHAQLRVGFNAMMIAGMDSLQSFRPTLTLLYKPTHWLAFVAGTLQDKYQSSIFSSHHGLPYPVNDPARHYLNYQEDGIQIVTDTRLWKSDTWLDWRHYLVPWTPDQELFTMRSKHEFVLLNRSRLNTSISTAMPLSGPCITTEYYTQQYFRVLVPCFFIANHRGGELKTIDTNTVTHFNEQVGLRFEYEKDNGYRYHKLALDFPMLFYHLDSKVDHGGNAFYPTLSYRWSKSLKTDLQSSNTDSRLSIFNSLGFWRGNHFFSPLGSPLFWSANSYSSQHMYASVAADIQSGDYPNADIRNLLTYTLSFEHQFKGVALGLQVDYLHDFDLSTNDFIFSFFIKYNGHFGLL